MKDKYVKFVFGVESLVVLRSALTKLLVADSFEPSLSESEYNIFSLFMAVLSDKIYSSVISEKGSAVLDA